MKNKFFKTMQIILGCLLMLTACNNSNDIQDGSSSDTIVNSTGGSSEDSDISTENSGNSADDSKKSTPESKPSTTETPNNSSDVITGTRAIIAINGVEYGMTITDTTIGRAFAKKLQDEGSYTVTGSRAADDICCSENEALETDPSENMPWVCGGIAWTGTWFTVWVSEEDAGRDMPVIAQIDEEHLEELQKVSGSMEIEVQLAAE